MADSYDLIVIGAGSAGLSAASFGARLGARVALIERDRVGGDCTWTGCVPSKALLHAAKVAHELRRAAVFGLQACEPAVDLGSVMASVQRAIQRVYRFETPEQLAEDGIRLVPGTARFLDPSTVEVDSCVLRGKRFVICIGARPVIPPIPGLAETPHLTYRTIFDLKALPRHLLVLGAGPIGVEFAQAFRRLGSAVTILEQAEQILPAADPDASAALAAQLRAEGVALRTGVRVEGVEGQDGHVLAAIPGPEPCKGDALLVAVGRQPDLSGLDLGRAAVKHTLQGIQVDERLRTSQPHIYAAGDGIGSHQFTHYAGWQGFIAARNALLPGTDRGVRAGIPWVVFTDPEVGQVGLSEWEARERGEVVEVHLWPGERIDRAQAVGGHGGLPQAGSAPRRHPPGRDRGRGSGWRADQRVGTGSPPASQRPRSGSDDARLPHLRLRDSAGQRGSRTRRAHAGLARVAAARAGPLVAVDVPRGNSTPDTLPAATELAPRIFDLALLDQEGRSVTIRSWLGRPLVLIFLRWLG